MKPQSISAVDFDALPAPKSDRSRAIARAYLVDGRPVAEIMKIYECSKTGAYKAIRRALDAYSEAKARYPGWRSVTVFVPAKMADDIEAMAAGALRRHHAMIQGRLR
jgi:hypothetical protein